MEENAVDTLQKIVGMFAALRQERYAMRAELAAAEIAGHEVEDKLLSELAAAREEIENNAEIIANLSDRVTSLQDLVIEANAQYTTGKRPEILEVSEMSLVIMAAHEAKALSGNLAAWRAIAGELAEQLGGCQDPHDTHCDAWCNTGKPCTCGADAALRKYYAMAGNEQQPAPEQAGGMDYE